MRYKNDDGREDKMAEAARFWKGRVIDTFSFILITVSVTC